MKPFLQRIAQAFYKEYGADVVERTFVFPNRRAGLFFQRYLSDAIDRPLFSPDVMTINECIQLAAREQPVDRLGALFRLYASYRKVSGSDEGFDNFVFWGEMLLADFDSYCQASDRVVRTYADPVQWNRMSLHNIARSGIFAADRAVAEYADHIWHVPHK